MTIATIERLMKKSAMSSYALRARFGGCCGGRALSGAVSLLDRHHLVT